MQRPEPPAARRYRSVWGWPKAFGGRAASWGIWFRRGDMEPHIVRLR